MNVKSRILAMVAAAGLWIIGAENSNAALTNITAATGGTGISLDTTSSASNLLTTLSDYVFEETNKGDISNGSNIDLIPSAGFRFDTNSSAFVTASITNVGGNGTPISLSSTSATKTATLIRFNVSGGGTGQGRSRLTIRGLRVQPTNTVPTAGTITVTNGAGSATAASLSSVAGAIRGTNSVVTISTNALVAGGVANITVQTRDRFGNNLSGNPGATVVLTKGSGTSDGTLSSPTFSANGAYTATFTANTVGTTRTISTTVNGTAAANTVSVKVNGLSVQNVNSSYIINAGDIWRITMTVGGDNLPGTVRFFRVGDPTPIVEKIVTTGPTNVNVSAQKYVQAEDAGSYRVVFTDNLGFATTNNITLTVQAWPGQIVDPVDNVTVAVGSTLKLISTNIIGSTLVTNQWYKNVSGNWVALDGQTKQYYSKVNTQLEDAGQYKLVAGNHLNTTLSESIATVTVNDGVLSVAKSPVSITVLAGDRARMTALIYGDLADASLIYQWQKQSGATWVDVAGQIGVNLEISPVEVSDAGVYRLKATDSLTPAGVFTTSATLTVLDTFVAASGSYNGLFSVLGDVALETAGSIRLTMLQNGRFSGAVSQTGTNYSFSGQFNTNGEAGPLTVNGNTLSLTTDFATTVGGTYGSTEVWLDRATSGNAYDGVYRAAVAGVVSSNSAAAPSGSSYLEISIAGSNATITARLADGTVASQRTTISDLGFIPFYVNLYSGQGVGIGWLSIDLADTDNHFEGSEVDWIKSVNAGGTLYTNGFHVAGIAVGSTLSVTAPIITADGGNQLKLQLSGAYMPETKYTFTISSSNTVTFVPAVTGLKMTITPATGSFSGSFRNTGNTNAVTTFRGTFLQLQGGGQGFFLSTGANGTESGAAEVIQEP